jgi:hypothetical protein
MFRRVGTQLINLRHVSAIYTEGSKLIFQLPVYTWLVIAGSGGTDAVQATEYYATKEEAQKAFQKVCQQLENKVLK